MKWRSAVGLLAVAGALTAGAVHAEPAHSDPVARIDDHPWWKWTTDDGKIVTLGDFNGTPVVVAMFFTSCPTRCPRVISKLKEVDAEYTKQGIRAQFVLVTMDPTHDTPERLREFRAKGHFPAHWHLLNGPLAQTHDLAQILGVRPAYDDTHIIHDLRSYVFDAHGTLLRTLKGWEYDTAEAVVK